MRLKRKFGLVLYLIPVVFLIVLLFMEIMMARKELDIVGICYRESNSLAYRVKLKPNNYGYDSEFLSEDKAAIASLIDRFIVNYKYQNTFSSDLDYKVTYDVTAELKVYDANNDEKPVWSKKYSLIDKKTVSGKGIMAKLDLDNNEINYDEYIAIVNQLKKEVIPDANLIVKFNTSFEGTSDLIDKKVVSSQTSTLTIPVSQKTISVDIKKDSKPKEECVNAESKISTATIILIVSTIILLLIFAISYIIYVIKTEKKKTKYEQAVDKILREFDRAIAEAKGKLRLDKSDNTIEVKDFMELLDIHDNLNIPIIYYKFGKHCCVFIVRNNSDVYYSVMKSDDFND